jgi:sugar lactone lactonase YvrE
VDIIGCEIHFFDPGTRRDTSIKTDAMPGIAIPRASGGLVLAVGHGFGFMDTHGRLKDVAVIPQEEVTARMNDGNCDSAGRFWAGSMGLNAEPGVGALYRLDPDLTVTRVLDGITESNGMDWSPDDRLMYYIDTMEKRVDVFDFDVGTGAIADRRPFASIDGADILPDGLTVDAEGYVWVCCWGGSEVRRFSPNGALERVIRVPTRQVTSCTFGGPRLEDLYVTSAREWLDPDALETEPDAGAVFVCRPGVAGRPQRTFAG